MSEKEEVLGKAAFRETERKVMKTLIDGTVLVKFSEDLGYAIERSKSDHGAQIQLNWGSRRLVVEICKGLLPRSDLC